MCLITEQKRVKITKEDMVVYKSIEKYDDKYYSVHYGDFEYIKNKLNKTNLTVDNRPEAYADSIVSKAYNFDTFTFERKASKLNNIHEGLHFATNAKRLSTYNDHLAEFLVPKGSRVYFDKTGLGVSNQIIFKKLID